MGSYQIVDIISQLSVFLGLSFCVCAFLLPRGWTSPLCLILLIFGFSIVVGAFTHSPDGRTWNKVVLSRALIRY